VTIEFKSFGTYFALKKELRNKKYDISIFFASSDGTNDDISFIAFERCFPIAAFKYKMLCVQKFKMNTSLTFSRFGHNRSCGALLVKKTAKDKASLYSVLLALNNIMPIVDYNKKCREIIIVMPQESFFEDRLEVVVHHIVKYCTQRKGRGFTIISYDENKRRRKSH
jgi:hypothetical protein